MEGNPKLSQAEIDALLNNSAPAPVAQNDMLSFEARDALGEIGNISFGAAATSLSTLLQQRVDITTPEVTLISQEEAQSDFKRPYVFISVGFTEGLMGTNALAIELSDAKTVADLMLGGDGLNPPGELNELHLSAVGEAMNQMMGGAATAMSTMFGRVINISPPQVEIVDLSSSDPQVIGIEGWQAKVAFHLQVGTLIDSTIMQLIPVPFARQMVSLLLGEAEGMLGSGSTGEPPRDSAPKMEQAAQQPWQAQRMEAPEPAADAAPATERHNVMQLPPAKPVLQPQFAEFRPERENVVALPRNLALLYDVPLNVTVELGRARRAIRDILDLAPGSILELDKLAGEPVDILVNNKRIATGEVVVIDENFGVRVTDIVSQLDRVHNLQ